MLPLLLLLAASPPSFEKDVLPVLRKNCGGCHNSRQQEGGVNLLAFPSESSVTPQRDLWETVARKIDNAEMPPAPLPKLPPAQARTVSSWVDQHFARLDRQAKPDAGRVTARRLNRFEYNNTIRDLLGIDFQPAADFPADDSGYGFDNIGDVLTLSPLLMEKYLNAAEQILRRAINTEPLPQPARVNFAAGRMKGRRAYFLSLTHDFPAAGDYDIQAFLNGPKAAGPEWKTNIRFSIDGGDSVEQEVVLGDSRPRNATSRAHIDQPGVHRIRVEFDPSLIPNAADEVNDRSLSQFSLLIDRLEIRGPYNPLRVEPPSQKQILFCTEATPGCARQILARFAGRAWRRPASTRELDALTHIATKARTAGDSFEQSMQAALEAVLVSPHFLFRIETGDGRRDKDGMEWLSGYELASRLSYFLWASLPDDTLLDLAAAGKLRDTEVLLAQVRRMLASPKAVALADGFAGQWLEYRNLDLVRPDPTRFPAWTPALKSAMQDEARLTFLDTLRTNASLLSLIDSPSAWLNETLARHYNIPGVSGPAFRKVQLPDGRRGGILSMASVLTVSSYPTRTSPVLRGKWILENILNAPPPPPPPDVQPLDEKSVGTKMSMREQLKLHRANPTCASCHSRMDVLGFGLENYDAIGAWRERDGAFPLDVSGTLPTGETFSGPAELKRILLANPQPFASCLTEKLLTYALGRGLDRSDRPVVRSIVKSLALRDFRSRTLIEEIVKSAPFRKRRPEAPKS
jgi:hypothetical protein